MCEANPTQLCAYALGACFEQLACLVPGYWVPKPTPAGVDCCPTDLPEMGDSCPSVGILCEYPASGGCPGGGYSYQVVCGPLGWYPVLLGNCNPPPPCPMEEPVATAPCPLGNLDQPLSFSGCRYGHGACFSYWACSPSTFWRSENGMADGCCGADEPTAASSCPSAGSACTYGSDLTTCGTDGWVITALPGGNGGSPGSTGGSGGAGGDTGAGGG